MKEKFPLFSAYGIEVEYMMVNQMDLNVSPIFDQLIFAVSGQFQNELTFDHIAWSNELVLHVVELKTNGPVNSLQYLRDYFQLEVQKINGLLNDYKAQLLPTGAHPWMNPQKETRFWPHNQQDIYQIYHKIFNCYAHGWSNLQSTHLNLSFANDDEFAKLHTSIRLILPIIPALSASTPIIEGKLTGLLDNRLEFYRLNQKKIPSVTGQVIPELIFTEAEYREKILQKMYRDINAYDPNKLLQEEWLNSRGAIARFDRNTIEIRTIDSQECPQADLSIISFIIVLLKLLVSEQWQPFKQQATWSENRLQKILLDTIKFGLNTVLHDEDYATVFGLHKQVFTARELLLHIYNEVSDYLQQENGYANEVLEMILAHGNLAERITAALKTNYSREKLTSVYQHLANCLHQGQLFLPWG